MIQILSRDLPKRQLPLRRAGSRLKYRRMLAGLAAAGARFGPRLLRALVLLLVALIVLFVGLMVLTGRYEAGAPVIGSLLLIGLGASHWA